MSWYDPDEGIPWYLILIVVVIVSVLGVLAGIEINDRWL